MPDLLKEARKAARKGDLSRAGDLFDLAGHPHEAIQVYVEGGHFLLAAQVASRNGDLTAAAGYFAAGGDHIQAAEVYLRSGQRRKAAVMYERAGQYLRAAEVEEKMGNLGVAAAYYETGGQLEKAAYLYAQVGNNLKAAELYEDLIRTTVEADSGSSGAFSSEETRKRSARYARFSGILHFKAGQYTTAGPRLEEAGLFEQAVEAYRKASQTARAAQLLVRLENYAEALRVVEEDPTAKIDGRMLGELLLRGGQYARAAETFLAENLGFKAAECFESAGDLARAAQLFAAEGEHIRAADLFAAIGRFEEAAESYGRGGEDANAAQEYLRAGQPTKAVSAFVAAGQPTAAAEILLRDGDEDGAIRLLQRVKRRDAEHSKAALLLGTVFARQGLHTLALEKFEAALAGTKEQTQRARCLYNQGLAFEQMGRIDEARGAYERVLSIDYHHADVAQRVKRLARQLAAARRASLPPGPAGKRSLAVTPAPAEGAACDPGAETPPASSQPVAQNPVTARLDFVKVIGRGRHGEVLEAYDRALHRRVAVRKFPPAPDGPDLYGRLLREAERSRELIHPNVVTVFGTAEDASGRYIITELVEGQTLRDLFDEKVRLEPAKIMSFAQQAAELLSQAHRKGLLHRDLRPENIFIIGTDTLKIADFGLKSRFSDATEREGQLLCYASPELIRGERVDARSDIYALGVVIYEMFLGEPPFPPETAFFDHLNTPPSYPQKVDRVIPAFLKKIIGKCLEKDPARRYRSAGLLADDLRASGIVPGVIVADRYEIVREIGIGGMGRVYQAVDRELDEVVAIKVLRVTDVEGKQLERFLREIKLARRIGHPNVVKVYDLGSWRDHKYITMEYIDGVNLEQWRRLAPSVEIDATARMMIDVARALESAHALGIIHRDIKPQNILIQGGTTPKLLDFGIARSKSGEVDLTTAGFVMGSPKYMSPEQVQALPLDSRTDIYSLGVVMYFAFTGREPFVGDTPTGIAYRQIHGTPRPPEELNGAVPPWLAAAILKAMEKDAKERYASMAELASALEAGLAVEV